MRIGRTPITPAAAIGPHRSGSSRSGSTPTGTVCAFGVAVSVSAMRKSLYVAITPKIAVAARPGAASGRMIRRIAEEPRVAVDERRLLDVVRDLVEEALHHPDDEARVDPGVDEDQAEAGVEQPELRQREVEGNDEQDRRDDPHEQRRDQRAR